MNIAAFIARRVAFNPERSFSRFIVRLSVTATVISVAVMLITIAFAGGFQQTISNKIFSFFGHVRVQDYNALQYSVAEDLPLKKNDSVYRLPKIYHEISKVQAYATKNAVLKTAETIEGVLFKGVEKDYAFSNLQPFLVDGRWVNFPDSGYSNEINLSESVARSLKLKVNDPVLLFFIQPDGAPRARKLQVVGIFKTGIEEYDKIFVLGDLRLIQRLNGWAPDEVGGYELFLKDYRNMDAVSTAITNDLPWGNASLTIREIIPSLFDWLALQNKTIYIVILIMVVIALLNLVTCLLILVLERTRMVGLLKALGASTGTLQQIFLYQGSIITAAGIGGGTLLGLLICWLQEKYGFIKLPEESYYISQAAVHIVWWQVALVIGGTFIVSMLVLLLPSLIVRRVQAVKAIQFR